MHRRDFNDILDMENPTVHIISHPDDIKPTCSATKSHLLEACGAIVMGTPIGSDAFIKEHLREELDQLFEVAQIIMDFPDAQAQFIFLRLVLCNKINHLQRTIRPELISDFVREFDKLKRQVLCAILHIPSMSDEACAQATMQFEYGGMGLRNTDDTTDAAFVASALSCLPSLTKFFPQIMDMIETGDCGIDWLQSLHAAACRLSPTDEDYYEKHIAFRGAVFDRGKLQDLNLGNADKLQAALMVPRNKKRIESFILLPEGTPRREASRRLSVSSSEAAAIFRIACLSPGRHLGSQHFIVAALQFLGVPLNTLFSLNNCVCNSRNNLVDEFGDHFFSCPRGNERFVTHDGLKLVISALCNYAGIRTKIEPAHCLLNINSRSDKEKDLRPDILAFHAHVRVLRPCDQHGLRNLSLDVSVCHPPATCFSSRDIRHKQNAAKLRERQKIAKYSRLAEANNLDFLPLTFETFGTWGPLMHRFFEDIIAAAARFRQERKGPIAEYWMQRISAAIHFGCANLIINRIQRISDAAVGNRDECVRADCRCVQPQL